jgi:hypothetical protein
MQSLLATHTYQKNIRTVTTTTTTTTTSHPAQAARKRGGSPCLSDAEISAACSHIISATTTTFTASATTTATTTVPLTATETTTSSTTLPQVTETDSFTITTTNTATTTETDSTTTTTTTTSTATATDTIVLGCVIAIINPHYISVNFFAAAASGARPKMKLVSHSLTTMSQLILSSARIPHSLVKIRMTFSAHTAL